jgi:hypothetical protein
MKVENIFLYTKNDFIKNKGFFVGYAFDDCSIIFGQDGLNEILDRKNLNPFELEGRFAGLFRGGLKSVIKTDKTGQELLFYYNQNDYWAVSNSFFLLLKHIAQKFKLFLHKPAVQGFHIRNGTHIGEQTITHKTMADGIELLPITAHISVDNNTADIEVYSDKFNALFQNSLDDYEGDLISFLEKGSGLLLALLKMHRPINLTLSGGYDSRIVLGMLLIASQKSEFDLSNVHISSHEWKENDFNVAKKLSSLFNLPLNNFETKGSSRRISSADSLKLYFISAGGMYLPIYPVTNLSLSENYYFHLTGDEPVGRDYYIGDERYKGTARKVSRDIFDYFRNRNISEEMESEFLDQFRMLDVDVDAPDSMIAMYTTLRSRLHGGRNSYKSLGKTFLFTTLIQSSLVSLSLHNLSHGHNPNKKSIRQSLSS